MALVEVRNVTKRFKAPRGETLSLDNVSLNVENEEFLAIVGPSGCGKSTLLRMMAGLDFPTGGSITFKGEPVTGPGPAISMVFQNFALLPWKTARENVLLALEAKAMPKEQKERTTRELLAKLGLAGFEDEHPHELSGGMKQRVGIARALAVSPDVLLLDEPFSALDEVTARELREEVLRIWRDRSTPPDTFVIVTHLVEEAVLMADRVVVMSPRPGRVVAEVPIDIPRPRNQYARSPIFFEHVDRIEGILEHATRAASAPPAEV